ncbi:MAG TPA: hypothetical protein VL092_08625 [Chitinophagaceae bacterium]|nr:hypothetical protein [Chitinophagaceae bacterium]
MHQRIINIVVLFIVSGWLVCSCKKQEGIYDYHPAPIPENATGKDTALSATALLNTVDFKALGRALQPDSLIKISIFDFNSGAFLEIALGADTPGMYTMGRSVSKHTAVYYTDAQSKQQAKGFTSRATDSAGGYVKVTEIDTLNHRVKGVFELLLLSRTNTNRYDFKAGSFDILYNYGTIKLDGTAMGSVKLTTIGLQLGSPVQPTPATTISFPNSLELNVALSNYTGVGTYKMNTNVRITLTDKKTGKKYESISGSLNLLRFNFGEFMQATFDCEVQSGDGEKKKITNGAFALGNI